VHGSRWVSNGRPLMAYRKLNPTEMPMDHKVMAHKVMAQKVMAQKVG